MPSSNDCLKVKRGMVFFVEDRDNCYGSVEKKGRPYLVISNDIGNKHSNICTVAAITSRKSCAGPYQVLFRNVNDDYNVILCEQIKTISISQLREYRWTVSDDVMKRVDKALRKAK